MLIDDFTREVNKAGVFATRLFSGAVKGAFMFAGLGVLAAAVIMAGPALWAIALGHVAMPATVAATMHAVFGGQAMGMTLGPLMLASAKIGAMIGAPLLAVMSVAPGQAEGYGRKPQATPEPRRSQDMQMERARSMQQMPDNPAYKPDLGAAALKNRGAGQQQNSQMDRC